MSKKKRNIRHRTSVPDVEYIYIIYIYIIIIGSYDDVYIYTSS